MPASVGLVMEVRDELRAEMRSGFKHLDSKISRVQSEVQSVQSEVQKVLAASHRTQTLMEEQRSENRIVLDGLKTVLERMDQDSARVDEMEKTLRNISQKKKEISQ